MVNKKYSPESLTSIMASLLGELVESRRVDRASRVMRGRVAIDIDDILRGVFNEVNKKSVLCIAAIEKNAISIKRISRR